VGVHVLGATIVWSAMLLFVDGLWFRGSPPAVHPTATSAGGVRDTAVPVAP
jgi:hypothetical protein